MWWRRRAAPHAPRAAPGHTLAHLCSVPTSFRAMVPPLDAPQKNRGSGWRPWARRKKAMVSITRGWSLAYPVSVSDELLHGQSRGRAGAGVAALQRRAPARRHGT